jgi:C terminal of Calcineurin-like phosphoesterase/N terminal of Calcineurin-like phosphoesterase/Calcineurin-like phosphoesterase
MPRYRASLVDFVALALLVLAFAGPANAAETARGTVFNDQNRNGVRDAGEPGIPGACVSNGREVVQTGADGAWSLPVDDDTALFVIKPAHYAVPVNADQVPQYYYLHKPAGSSTRKSPGVPPSGPLPESIDFPLYPRREDEPFTTVFFGDTQARGLREVNFITHDVVEELIGVDAAFGVSLGDLVADDPALFKEIGESIGQIGVPWYNIIGNHDNNRDHTNHENSDETFERYFGPSVYAFEHGEVVFVGLNNIYREPGASSANHFSEDQLVFLEDYLAKLPHDRLIVLMMHVPIVACDNREAVFRLIEDRPHNISTAGHVHEQFHMFLDETTGWRGKEPHHMFVSATVSGSWWCGAFDELGIPHATMNDGAPNGYSFITFDGNEYAIRFKAARRPADHQMNIYLLDDIEQSKAGEAELLVNVFAGSERSTVEMRLGNEGPWQPLEQTVTIDPECLRMHEQSPYLDTKVQEKGLDEVFGWKMDYPSKCRHMWKGTLPENPTIGTHTVTVRTTDMFGQTSTGRRIVRIREDGELPSE